MALHYEGYEKARRAVEQMNEQQLYEQIDILFGRGNLPEDPSLDELRAEALRQVDRDWTDTQSPEYKEAQLWANLRV